MKDILNYEGLYAVTSCGRVWSYRNNKFLAPQLHNKYYQITLSKDGVKKTYLIHKLVAEAYIPNPNNLPQINHKDENSLHNWVNNLEYCDAKYNNNYGSHREKQIKSQGKRCMCVETEKIYPSTEEAARQLGIQGTNIRKVCRGEAKTAGGYCWRYL